MDAQQFLAEFGHIANAPGGVARLKELVIQLAISGKLVEPAATEGHVSDVINQAFKIRKEYEAKLELRPTQSHDALESGPFTIPVHWKWARLDQLTTYIQRGKGPKYVERSATRVVSQKCVQWSGFDLTPAKFVSEDTKDSYDKERYLCYGDLLWNSTGTGTVGRIAIFDVAEELKAVADSHVTVIRLANFSPRYLWCVIASPWVQARINPSHTASLVSGTTQQVELSTSTARALPIPCPPIEEQSRIVAKVDELMALCDQLEAQQQQRRSLQNKLRQSTLQAVAAATSPHELQTTWARLADSFGQLFDMPDDVKALRDVIFELAMRGVLLPNATMETIASKGELPGLPTGWVWKTLGELSKYITSGSRGWKDYIAAAGDAFIRSQDIKQDALVFENPAFVALPDKAEGKRTLVKERDLLLTITGGNVGKCAIVPVLSGKAYVSQHVALIRLNESNLAEFIHYWMINSYGGRGFLGRYIYGDKPGLNLAQVATVAVPIPTESARLRILESLRLYQSMCDRLTLQVQAKQRVAAMLSLAATAAITGVNITEEEAPLKAPQTELIAPLRLGKTPNRDDHAPLATLLTQNKGELFAGDLCNRFGHEIDVFYAQLKQEVAHGWIQQPEVAEMREKAAV